LRTYGNAQPVREKLLKLFEPFFNQLSHFGLNSVSSVYDGNAPHTPRGLVGDACAVGEIIRCYEELISEGPKKETSEKFELK
jgi:glycogen debranching enzyme